MKIWGRAKDVAIAVIISLEVLAILACVCLYELYPALYDWMTPKMFGKEEVTKYICLLPSAVFVLLVSQCYQFLLPGGWMQDVLHGSPAYKMLKDRCVLSILWAAVSALAGVAVFACVSSNPDSRLGLLGLCAIVVALITYGTFFLARIKVKEILIHHKP